MTPPRTRLRPFARRDVLRLGLGGAAAAGLPLAGCAGDQSGLTTTELADGVALISGGGGNVVAVRGPDGAVLIDGGAAEHSQDVIRAATRAVGRRKVAALFNTHWHFDQTGSNAALGAEGVPIIAHENTRLWLGTTIYRRWEEKTYPPAPAEAAPTETIYTSASLPLEDDRIDYGYMIQAHTDGDIYAHLPGANVIAAGGAVSGAGWPIVDWSTGGWLGGMIDAIQTIADMSDETTKIVPADGPVLSRADLERQHEMYATILGRMADDMRASLSPVEMAAKRPTAEYDEEMGDPSLFVSLAYESIWSHLRSDRRVGAI